MRFGRASTTVTGTVAPASVNTRVMPHLRPTRPMVIVKVLTARERRRALRFSLQSAGGLGTPDPSTLGLNPSGVRPLDRWRRHPRAPASKMDGGVYVRHALRATIN